MTRRAFLQQYIFKFAVVLAMLGLIAYTVGHAIGSGVDHLLTTPARSITDRRITSAKAYLFRDETLLLQDGTGLVDELIPSGSKVGKNVAVADWYPSGLSGQTLAARQNKVDALNRAIDILRRSDVGGESISEAEGYRKDAEAHYMEICAQLRDGDLSTLVESEKSFLIDLNRYLQLSGQSETADRALEGLIEEKKALLGDSSTPVVNTAASGTYYGNTFVDGYETRFTLDALEKLTEASFDALRESDPVTQKGKQTAGKVVYGYSWYAVMEIPEDVRPSFEAGERYTVAFPENGGRELQLTLERTVGALAIFRSDDSPADFVFYRAQAAQITVDTCEGIYIPDTALYTVDGAVGVYVLENSTAHFRRIVILYRGDGYCIAARPEDDARSQLKEYDVLITSGRNLHDGRVYQ